jgi:maleamate amidohydrolase
MARKEDFEDHCWADVVPVADMRLYARYARETKVGASPALLAIDLYNTVYRGDGRLTPYELEDEYRGSCGIYAHRAIAPTKRLFAAARAANLPIFYSTGETRPNARPAGAVATRSSTYAPKEADAHDIYHEFSPLASDVVIFKQRASVFQGTPILSHLTLLGVRSLIVCGESTSGCVRASAVDAYSAGFHVSIVEECTFDRSELMHKINLFDLHHKYCDVIGLNEVEAHLETLRAD